MAKATKKTKRAAKRAPTRRKPAPRTASAERKPDEALILRTLELLHRHARAIARANLDVGEHLLVHYFANDPDLAQSNDPQKPRSYTRLAARAAEETDWSATTSAAP